MLHHTKAVRRAVKLYLGGPAVHVVSDIDRESAGERWQVAGSRSDAVKLEEERSQIRLRLS